MFCKYCGSQMADSAAFCPACGATNENAGGSARKPGGKLSGKVLLIGIAAVAVILVVVLLVNLLGGRSLEETVEAYLDAIFEADAEAIAALIHPDVVEATIEKQFDGDEDDFYDALEGLFEQILENFEDAYGKIKKVDYEIKDEDKLDEDDIEELIDGADYRLDVELEIKEAVEVEIEVEIHVEGDEDDQKGERTLTFVKIDNNWYVYVFLT